MKSSCTRALTVDNIWSPGCWPRTNCSAACQNDKVTGGRKQIFTRLAQKAHNTHTLSKTPPAQKYAPVRNRMTVHAGPGEPNREAALLDTDNLPHLSCQIAANRCSRQICRINQSHLGTPHAGLDFDRCFPMAPGSSSTP